MDDWPEGRPQILDVSYVEQTSWDVTGLTFELSFSDSDGDLGKGKLEVLVKDEETSSIGLDEVFSRQVPPIDLDAKMGLFTVNASVDGLNLNSDDLVDFEFVLQDQAGEASNRAQLTLLTIFRKE